jgi:3-oxoacyl-[acyl-carrier protein] reductase
VAVLSRRSWSPWGRDHRLAAASTAGPARFPAAAAPTFGCLEPAGFPGELAGGAAIAIAADVSSRAEYQAMVQRLLAEFGRWDILVNNAAVAVTKPFGQITEAEFDLSFAVNVKGVFHGLQLAWEHLADEGRIITISSSTTALMLPGYSVYDATKGAVEQFTHILSKEFGPRGITVNAVSPGATETETYRTGKSEQFLAGLEAMSAFGRLGRPDEIAAVVAFLAGDAARWVTCAAITSPRSRPKFPMTVL